uniref:molybdopterin biosynthesis protein n=1 Tax=Pulvinaster venetus TaxID=427767 RepID=UPI001FCD795F|nr:molybdopterin biosynthesis protein [Pulvinaster venetus]UNJ16965.1 molybdopterin biosynthesis protein [Pulvinaster venetus]
MLNPKVENIVLSLSEYKRYSRHLVLNSIGIEGQKRLKTAKVICIGAGGLSSPVIMYLSSSGIGHIGIIDDDIVEVSNLQRQIMYNTYDIGNLKVECVSSKIHQLNPHCFVKVYISQLNHENALKIISSYDIIIDGTDNFKTRYLINDIAWILHKPVIYGAIFQFSGQISVFNYRGGPTYRDLYSEKFLSSEIPTCSQGGILGPVAGIIGSLQAVEVIKIILGLENILNGKLLIYDALTMSFRYIAIVKSNQLLKAKSLIQSSFYNLLDQSEDLIPLSVNNLHSISFNTLNYLIIDVRTSLEYKICHINNSINILLSRINKLKELVYIMKNYKQKKTIILYCYSKSRSIAASLILLKYGIKNKYIAD